MNQHSPGEWPAVEGADEDQYVRLASERARREMVLNSIRAHLEEQPTRNSVLSVARHWCADIVAMAGEVAKKLRSSG